MHNCKISNYKPLIQPLLTAYHLVGFATGISYFYTIFPINVHIDMCINSFQRTNVL